MGRAWAGRDVDPESATERALVVVLADVSSSMAHEIQDSPELGAAKSRIDALKQGLANICSPHSEVSMHDAKDFDGIAEFALGVFPGRPDQPQSVKWIDFAGARKISLDFS